jgi:hypothetical protein
MTREGRHLPTNPLPEHQSLVLLERYKNRAASAEHLTQLVLKSERRTAAPTIVAQYQELAQQTARARLDRLEREHLVDKIVMARHRGVGHVTELSVRPSATMPAFNTVHTNIRRETSKSLSGRERMI